MTQAELDHAIKLIRDAKEWQIPSMIKNARRPSIKKHIKTVKNS